MPIAVEQNAVTQTRLMWGMPITIQVVENTSHTHSDSSLRELHSLLELPRLNGEPSTSSSNRAGWQGQSGGRGGEVIDRIFEYFAYIDEKFSTYKPYSEISLINQGALTLNEASLDMRTVFALSEAMRQETGGYFNIEHDGKYDPSGLVKGWAVANAADMIRDAGYANFYVEAGGDFQASGNSPQGRPWRVGIRNPFNINEIVKVLSISDRGVATSGTYIRGNHIYNPVESGDALDEILSITVIGPDVYEADCYATAAFSMGRNGIGFIESLEGFEGYMIDKNKMATFTRGFERYVDHATD